MPLDSASGPAAFVEIDGREYQAKDFAWESNIMVLADQWSVTVPCPNGKALGTDGQWVPAHEAFKEGARVKFYVRDPDVRGNVLLCKLVGRLVTIDDSEDPQGGYVVRLSGYDLGWHLTTGHGRVFTNLRGVKWQTFLQTNVLNDAFGWGFAGIRPNNILNKNFRLGRAAIVAAQSPTIGAVQPRFQIDVGQSLGPLLIEFAKREKYLLNVSADGYLQFFKPDYTQETLYSFSHRLRSDELGSEFNNVRGAKLRRSADDLYTRVECWSTVTRPPAISDSEDPNEGRYHGTYQDLGTLPFFRAFTFSDGEQIGQAKVDARAKWRWQRGIFDSWEYTFTVKGISQNGVPYEPDTMCEIVDEVRGLNGRYYISSVRYSRKLAKAGLDGQAGTTCQITIKKPGFLGA